MDGLVSVDWLAVADRQSDVILLDCSVAASQGDDGKARYASGAEDYARAHIPGAVHADLVADLSDTASDLIFALPDPDDFRRRMEALGVGNGRTVVLYDRSFTAWAARVWWMLRWIGFDDAVILDGGYKAWVDAGHPTRSGPETRPPGAIDLKMRPEAMVDQRAVGQAISRPDVCLIDTLSADVFDGTKQDYARPGHISGASHLFTLSLFQDDGRFKSMEDLAALHDADKAQRQITYCGAGILASASAFVMVQLGFKDVGLYAASLQEWAADPENPMDVT